MQVDIKKKYRTEDGKEVVIYQVCTQNKQNFPVHGAVKNSNGDWQAQSWQIDGKFLHSRDAAGMNLVEVPSENQEIRIDKTKQYQTRSGRQVKIYEVLETNKDAETVFGSLLNEDGVWSPECWFADGRHLYNNGDSKLDLVEFRPYADLKKDDLVMLMARNDPSKPNIPGKAGLRYFSHLSLDGKPVCFRDGRNSKTAHDENDVITWHHVVKVDEEK